jgi:hypothetical protein
MGGVEVGFDVVAYSFSCTLNTPYNNDTCFFHFHDPCLYIYMGVYVWFTIISM